MMERKYYYSWKYKIVYQKEKHGLFTHVPRKEIKLYMYEENGRFYEFFSGYYMGNATEYYDTGSTTATKNNRVGYNLVIPESVLSFIIVPPRPYDDKDMSELTASEFAEMVQKYVHDKELIVVAVEEFFSEKHKEWVKRQEEEKRIAVEKAQKEQADISWLNKFIDGRK